MTSSTSVAAGAAISWPGVLDGLLAGDDLSQSDAHDLMMAVMAGEVSPPILAAWLTALRAKGETPGEIAGFVRAMVDNAVAIDLDGPLVDTCGTGGDGANTFNVSTTVAPVIAAAGVRVAKHGNRAASSRVGSADLLEHFGVVIDLPAPAVAQCIEELGIGFLFARSFHPAMRHVGPVRAALGVRTVFNILGPLSNPAGAQHQVVGVAARDLAPLVAATMAELGKTHVLVFRGEDGLDELTTTGPSDVWEVRDGEVLQSRFDPAELGIPRASLADLAGGEAEDNAAITRAVLQGQSGPCADLVAVNAGAALYAADATDSLAAGVDRAREVMASGAGWDLLERWAVRSQELAQG
ncbi:MAG TPA: anthranilate phosphoribosyltransferase [Nitriliruptoraceae bacterium]|nr:anthranilate phosphoribosyltransferase [Nitriliruptoraceae bacterium]